jgi:hypothetical protein
MSDFEGELMYDDEGQPIGYVAEAPDGVMILHDGQGQIVAAATPDGAPVDPGDYEFGEPDEQGDASPSYDEHPDYQAVAPEIDWNELGHQLNDAQRVLGRQMTRAEQAAASANLERQANRGEEINLADALNVAYETGQAEHLDMGTSQGKTAYIVDRLEGEEAAANALGTSANAPDPERVEYDPGTTDGKVASIMAKLDGIEAVPVTPDSGEAA